MSDKKIMKTLNGYTVYDEEAHRRIDSLEGSAPGLVFDTVADMEAYVAEHAAELKVGQNLYIREVDVPDYWWDGTAAQELETKVDLSGYAKQAEVDSLSEAIADLENKVDGAKTWNYTEGLPEANGYRYIGTQGKAVMQSNGVALSAGAEYRFPFANASESSVEFKFTITKKSSSYWGFVVIVTNGTKGIRLSIQQGIVYFDENFDNSLKVADITENEEHSLRVEYFDTGKADVYLDDNRIITNQISAPEYTTTLFKQDGSGTTLLHSITYSIPEIDVDYIPVPETAAVGQTIVVESVDASGKPTAWKAADLPSNTGGETATNVAEVPYRWAKRGYMRDHVRDFQGWAHCVQYDPDLELAVGIVISGTGSHSNSQPWYRVTIDPKTGYMSDYREIALNYGEATDTTEAGYVGSFLILPNGTYWMCDYQRRIWISADKGLTWDYVTEIANWNRTTKSNDSIFGATILSNGRIVAGNIGNPAAETYYSDDGLAWNIVKMDVSALGSQVYPEGGYKPFEPFFVDCGNGKVIQYARASMNAYKTYADGGYSAKEAACYSVSEDYGVTWSAWKWSTALTDMTACNGRAVVISDKIHAVYGSRYHAEDNHFHLFYATSTLDDILNDKWETPEVIEVGHWNAETATDDHDCGYPSLFVADGNLFAVYYDSDGTGSAFGANWRLCVGSQGVAQIAPVASGGGAKNVGYTQDAVDALILGQKTYFMGEIAKLYALIGQLPPDSGANDGSMYITDSLIFGVNVLDTDSWSDARTCKSVIGDGVLSTNKDVTAGVRLPEHTSAYFRAATGTATVSNTLSELGVDGTGFTMEAYWYADWGGANHPFFLNTDVSTVTNVQLSYKNVFEVAEDGSVRVLDKFTKTLSYPCYVHAVYVVDETAFKVYVDGTLLGTYDYTTDYYTRALTVKPHKGHMNNGLGIAYRIYNKALSADEVKNNYIYCTNNYATTES